MAAVASGWQVRTDERDVRRLGRRHKQARVQLWQVVEIDHERSLFRSLSLSLTCAAACAAAAWASGRVGAGQVSTQRTHACASVSTLHQVARGCTVTVSNQRLHCAQPAPAPRALRTFQPRHPWRRGSASATSQPSCATATVRPARQSSLARLLCPSSAMRPLCARRRARMRARVKPGSCDAGASDNIATSQRRTCRVHGRRRSIVCR